MANIPDRTENIRLQMEVWDRQKSRKLLLDSLTIELSSLQKGLSV
jgi:hypothetical protein